METCWYCEKPFEGRRLRTEDHKTPVSKGGSDEAGNLVASCQKCNSSKGNSTVGEFIARMFGLLKRAGNPGAGRPKRKD